MEESTEDAVMLSSRVKCLANEIYKQFDIIIKKHGESSVKNLMPLIVSILGNLEEFEVAKEELEINYNVLQEDQKFLVNELDKEKNSKRTLQERINKFEDFVDEIRREKDSERLKANKESKRLELTIKNLQDQLGKYEEREAEFKKNNEKLHERYSELLKNHAEYVDRMKTLGQLEPSERVTPKLPMPNQINNVVLQPKFVLSNPEKIFVNLDEDYDAPSALNRSGNTNSASIRNEMDMRSQGTTESTKQKIMKSILETTPELNCDHEMSFSPKTFFSYQNYRHDEPNFDDLSMSGDVVSDGSQDPFGVTREVQNILRENQELIQDRNAFKVALDDLMTQMNKLENENAELRDDINSQLRSKSSMQIRIKDLEQENIGLRSQVESLQTEIKNQDEENVPWAKKLWFSRSEMSKMIIERNHFKMQLTELQNNIEWIEINKAEQRNSKRKKKISEVLYSMLFGNSSQNESRNNASVSFNTSSNSIRSASMSRFEASKSQLPQVSDNQPVQSSTIDTQNCRSVEFVNPNLTRQASEQAAKCECYSDLFAKIGSKEAIIPGWECPSLKGILKHQETSLSTELRQPEKFSTNMLIQQLIDLTSTPIYSRPLNESYSDMEIWCGTSTYRDTPIHLQEGILKIGHSKFFHSAKNDLSASLPLDSSSQPNSSTPKKRASINSTTNSECTYELASKTSTGLPDERLSEMVWVCSITTRPNTLRADNDEEVDVKTQITIVDMNRPRQMIETFGVVKSQIFSIGSAPAFNKNIYEYLISTSSHWESIPFLANTQTLKEDLTSTTMVQEDPSPVPSNNNKSGPATEIIRQMFSVSRISFATKSFNASTFSNSTYATSYSSGPADISQETIKENLKMKGSTTEESLDQESPGDYEYTELPNTSQPTVWLGSQSGDLYIHSSVSHFQKALNTVKLPDSITSICYFKGRMFVSLANSKLYIFRRCIESKKRPFSEDHLPTSTMQDERNSQPEIGTWDLSQAVVVTCGHPQYSIRSIVPIVNIDALWIAYRNFIIVMDTNTFKLQDVIQAHPKRDAQIKQMAWIADGVWVSLRRESVIRLFHAFTHQHIQDVDIQSSILQTLNTNFNLPKESESEEPFTEKKENKLELKVTSLLPSRDQLWIGTSIGITITMPYSIYIRSDDRIEDITDTMTTENNSEYATVDDIGNFEGNNGPKPKMLVAARVEPGYLQISRYRHMKEIRFLLQIRAHGPPEAHSVLSRHKFGLNSTFSQIKETPDTQTEIEQRFSQIMIVSGGEGYKRLTKKGCSLHQADLPTSKSADKADNDVLKANFLFAWLLPNTNTNNDPKRTGSQVPREKK